MELLPRCSEIIARQLELVKSYQLSAERSGSEQNSRLQILPVRLNGNAKKPPKSGSASGKISTTKSISGGGNGTGVTRLPLLPE